MDVKMPSFHIPVSDAALLSLPQRFLGEDHGQEAEVSLIHFFKNARIHPLR